VPQDSTQNIRMVKPFLKIENSTFLFVKMHNDSRKELQLSAFNLLILFVLLEVLHRFWLRYFVPRSKRWDLPKEAPHYKTIIEMIQESMQKR
jgi:hypothetical protein